MATTALVARVAPTVAPVAPASEAVAGDGFGALGFQGVERLWIVHKMVGAKA